MVPICERRHVFCFLSSNKIAFNCKSLKEFFGSEMVSVSPGYNNSKGCKLIDHIIRMQCNKNKRFGNFKRKKCLGNKKKKLKE